MATKKKSKKKAAKSHRVPAKTKPATAKKKVAPPKKKVALPKKKATSPKKKPATAKKKAVAAKPARPKPRPAAKKRAARASTPAAKAAPLRRRDGAGHLDAKYAATLREKSREGRVRDSDEAFIGRSGHAKDELAEAMGESWVETATSGEDDNEEVFNQSVPEDDGGPFVPSTAGQEFAEGTDASNPKQSKREPFPKT
jgi:hypothetical protein